jgi:hypothetical protein
MQRHTTHYLENKIRGAFQWLQKAFVKAKYSGLDDNIHPPPLNLA